MVSLKQASMSPLRPTLKLVLNASASSSEVPPPPSGANLREWFAGLALANPTLMLNVPEAARVSYAVSIADELVNALRTPSIPTRESMRPPTVMELNVWETSIVKQEEKKRVQKKETQPQGLKFRQSPPTFNAIPPPPMKNAAQPKVLPENTRYSDVDGMKSDS